MCTRLGKVQGRVSKVSLPDLVHMHTYRCICFHLSHSEGCCDTNYPWGSPDTHSLLYWRAGFYQKVEGSGETGSQLCARNDSYCVILMRGVVLHCQPGHQISQTQVHWNGNGPFFLGMEWQQSHSPDKNGTVMQCGMEWRRHYSQT